MVRTALIALAATTSLAACATSGGGQASADRGIRVYGQGDTVYVCREAPTAATISELEEELRSDRPVRDSPTGETVRIARRESVDVDGRSTPVARVRAVDREAEYWIPYTALCSKG